MVPSLWILITKEMVFYFKNIKGETMKFKAGTRRKPIEYEKDLVKWWKENDTFKKSVKNRPESNSYVFYDGPPFITGVPHHGTLLSSIIKDVVPRYQTMKGHRVERTWGWDCHGLPAEVYTEKKLGIKGKDQILELGLEKYISACRENMTQTGSLWEDTIDRIGRWVNFKGAYKTMDNNYIESVWWAFKKLYEDGKVYEGEKVLMYCTQDSTPLSKAEVTMDAGAYKDITDPSVFVKFELKPKQGEDNIYSDKEKVYLLAWTTTPWTLAANTALAINKNLVYAEVKVNGENFIVARDLLEKVLVDEKHQPVKYELLKQFDGEELVGREYKPLLGENRGKNAHKIWAEDFVSSEDGSGIVHIAPAYGEDDFNMAQKHHIPVVHVLDEKGVYTEGEWLGSLIWDVNKDIAKTLKERGIVWKIEYIKHSYPHCHRCGTKLMYRAHPSWFMDIASMRLDMLKENSDNINWFPEHIKHGRFEKNIEMAPDWNLSRDRFWASPMPVWKGVDKDGKEHIKVVGSFDELYELSGKRLKDYHRPWIDDVTFELDGVTYQRIDKVMDCWFESGSMPFAQFHYPFENVEKFEANFPGDFIVEYVGQVRAWFYYVHAVNVGLFGHNAFKNVVVTGNIMGNDGRKMSKSYGNYTDPNTLMDMYSADSLRYTLLSSPLLNAEDFILQDKEVADVNRKLNMIWNMYDFFTMYAEVDNWQWDGNLDDPIKDLKNPLDIWVVSRLHQVVKIVEDNMDKYDLPNATRSIIPFIEDASNWYVRRSRRRFWKSDEKEDKNDAYKTLHYVLVRLSYLLAPFTPFLAEELFKKLTGKESVHLEDWKSAGHVNEAVVAEMETVRNYVNECLSVRAKNQLKVRQPLASVTIPKNGNFVNFEDIMKEELNVKEVKLGDTLSLDLALTDELLAEGRAREVIRFVQAARKKAGLNVDDRISLSLDTESEKLKEAIKTHKDLIMQEVLATDLSKKSFEYKEVVKVNKEELKISLEVSKK